MDAGENKRGYTLQDAAKYLGISVSSVRVLVADKKLPVMRIGDRPIIDKADLDALFDGEAA